MTQETATYLTNIGISVVLAGLLTHSWASQGRSVSMWHWMLATWMMVVTNSLFAARPELPVWIGRLVPTLFVTVALAFIFLGARVIAGKPLKRMILAALILGHGVLLVYFLLLGQPSHWRTVSNGVVWASLSFATFAAFRSGPAFFWRAAFTPANVMLVHGMFLLVRITLSVLSREFDWPRVVQGIQLAGDLEVSMFTVAIFVSILVATMRQHHEELVSAQVKMEQLSGLLPICAWCKKVRDDDGYWQQVEDYLRHHTQMDVTHGICASCAAERFPEVGGDGPASREKGSGSPSG